LVDRKFIVIGSKILQSKLSDVGSVRLINRNDVGRAIRSGQYAINVRDAHALSGNGRQILLFIAC
jgi:hypothetical protein